MKKFMFILVAMVCFGISANAQTRTKIADGLTLVRYGNTAVLEDDVNQRTIRLEVKQKTNSTGAVVYDFLCGNKYTKDLSKQALKDGITIALTALGGSTGASAAGLGGVAGAAAGAYIARYANTIAMNLYDDACNYFK
ncbi:hypothetical protein AGMMS50239_19000 [Bacteroidia bacterium]|nr:hypothetical protein AGMMS50239_19000 [Bacteroidia bacterium]